MKTVTEKKPFVRIVTEQVRLDDCAAMDRVEIRHVAKGCFGSIGPVRLVRIKHIPHGKVQIKYQGVYGTSRKVLKADLPADLIVERRREATEADGPDAGVPEVRTARHEGVEYRAVDNEQNVETLIEAAIVAGMGEGRSIRATIDLLDAFDDRTPVSTKFAPGPGKSWAMTRIAALAAMQSFADDRDEPQDRDPEMMRMGGWLDMLERGNILQPGAKQKLMGSIWTEEELRDGRPNPGSVIVDG